MQGYLATDLTDFVGVINITLINVTIVDNMIPLAIQLNETQVNITSLKTQSAAFMDILVNSTANQKTVSEGTCSNNN